MMNINDLTLGQIKEIQAMMPQPAPVSGVVPKQLSQSFDSGMTGKYCIIRTYSSGVHMGFIDKHDGNNAIVLKARRLWKWGGAFTLSAVATEGVIESKSYLSVEVEQIALSDVIEVIPCTSSAMDQLKKLPARSV